MALPSRYPSLLSSLSTFADAPATTRVETTMEDSSTGTTTSERPTFAEAFAADTPAAESLSAPTQESTETSPVAPASVDAIAPPADQALTDGTPVKGPIPYERHDAILKGAYKERDTYKTQLDSLAWAQGIDRGAIEQMASVAKLYETDRPGYLRQVMAEALANPELAPLVRSEAARVLGTRSQPQATPDDLAPDIPVVDERGQVVSQAYSADRVKQLIAKSVQDAIAKEVGPLRNDYQTRQAREHAAEQTRQAEADLKEHYDEMIDVLPGFKAHEAEIAKAMEAFPGDPYKAARKAWQQVVGSKLSNADETRTKQLDELKQKAAASMGNPAGAASTSTRRPTSFNDPSLQW